MYQEMGANPLVIELKCCGSVTGSSLSHCTQCMLKTCLTYIMNDDKKYLPHNEMRNRASRGHTLSS